MLSQQGLKQLMHYNPETGIFTWRITWGKMKTGSVVGYVHDDYLRVTLEGERFYLHQLAFLYMEGYIPALIDHDNNQGSDNRWCNLREADKSKNAHNAPKPQHNTSGYKGVSFCGFTGRWRASIRQDGRERNLGRYNTKEEAAVAYERAAVQLFKEFANTGVEA